MPQRIQDLYLRAGDSGSGDAAPEALHVRALIDLLYRPGAPRSVQKSISALQTAARVSDHPAPVLADLAAAYLVSAERGGTLRDLLAAIDAAQQALEREPRNLAALYNRALALQRFGLVEEAAHDWMAYLAVDTTSPWANEAKKHLRDATGPFTVPPPPARNAPAAAYAGYAAADPQGARTLGWCRVLADWGGATLVGDAAGAEAHLGRAEALARALEHRAGGDATLADAVRAIRSERGDDGARLARAHRAFAEGCVHDERVEFHAGARRFAAAARDAGASPALRDWARLMYGSMVFHDGNAPAGEAIFRDLAVRADTVHHSALAASARQLLAMVLLRSDRYEAVLKQAELAAALFRRAGERENEGVSLDALSNARVFLGDLDTGYLLAREALERLQPYRSSYRLHNLLGFTARIVASDGFARAAIRMQDEGVRVAERNGNPVYVAEARLNRAQLLAGAGARARTDVSAAAGALKSITDPQVHAWMVAQEQMVPAAAARAGPARAAAALDSAAAFFLRMHAPLLALPAVVRGAEARLAAGDVVSGTARLEQGLAILEQRRDSIRMEPRRAAVFEAARALVDRVAMSRLASGRKTAALASLDRGRASLAPVGPAGADDPGPAVYGPPGEVVLNYAVVGDTLLAWAVAGRAVELFRGVVDTASLLREVERLRRQLERNAGEAEVRPGLARLYELLVRPVEGRLGGAGTPLVVVADGDIVSVPFAALYDSHRGRYLVQDHPLRFAASLREARRQASRRHMPGATVFVADPAFDRRAYPDFPRLSGAAGEVREIATHYPVARVLADTGANGQTIRAELHRARVVHYAGHAVFDDERPERSYLLLAPSPRATAAGTLQAGEIAGMDLRGVSLVVLSACQTVRTGRGRAAGFSGLAGAFIAAGVGGAVGSLWEVDDRLTRPLMVEFHREYSSSGDGPVALRVAQLRLLGSGDATLRSPAVWAAFRYVGR